MLALGGGDLEPGLRSGWTPALQSSCFLHGWSVLGMDGRGLGHLRQLLKLPLSRCCRQPAGSSSAGKVGTGWGASWSAGQGNSQEKGVGRTFLVGGGPSGVRRWVFSRGGPCRGPLSQSTEILQEQTFLEMGLGLVGGTPQGWA